MLNLQEFRESRRIVDHETASTSIGDELYDTLGAAIYVDSCFVSLDEAGWLLVIGRDDYRGSLDELEARLYFDHYVQECVRDYNMEVLTWLYREFCIWSGLSHLRSAEDQLQLTLTPQLRQWLTWFIGIWEDLENLKPRWRVKLNKVGYHCRSTPPITQVVRASSPTEARKIAAEQVVGEWFATDILNIDELIKEYA